MRANRYLLLIDKDTKDVLTLLLYAHQLFGDNYSRKLANMKFSQVRVPASHPLKGDYGGLCWCQAFESPKHVKALIKHAEPNVAQVGSL